MARLTLSDLYRTLKTTVQRSHLLLAAMLIAACSADSVEIAYHEGQRIVQPLNLEWAFALAPAKGQIGEDDWKEITLPHTWTARDGQDGGDDYHRGTGIYRRQLVLDDSYSGRRLFLHFDGAAIATEVYVNGKLAGSHEGSYGAFRFDITGLVDPSESNQLEVRVSNVVRDHVAPLSADFTFFGGLYRRVRLIAANPVHIDAMNHASSGVFWTQQSVSKERANLELRSVVSNNSAKQQQLTVEARLEDHAGALVVSNTQQMLVEASAKQPLDFELQLDNPHLWHGRRDPYLYRGKLIVKRDGQVVDEIAEPLGLRFFRVDPDKGFFLNGEPYPLRGINRMPDFLNKGTAVSREDHERDIQLMMEIGATSLRLGHQQRDAWVYRRADELGLVVWAEIPLINRIQDTDSFASNLQTQALELIRQNYNRASIVIWGLYNEVTLKPGPDPRPLVQQLNTLVKAEDPQRLTSAAVAAEGALDDPLVTTPDLISFNRYDGWYYGNFDTFPTFLDHMREEAPALRMGIGEYGAGASVKFQTDKPVMQDHSEQYQALYHEAYWEALRERPWLWGHYIWVLADFAVDNRNEGDTPGRNDKGLVTFDRKVKKDAFYLYKANWSEEPVLYITGRRYTERIHGRVEIKLYSNLEQVELKVNGQSLGSKQPDDLSRLVWQDVPLQMGENRIEAVAQAGGKTLSDQFLLTRINSDDTAISSQLLGVDSAAGNIYNPPFGVSLENLTALLDLPEESTLTIADDISDEMLGAGRTVRVTAQDGTTTRDYQLLHAPPSVGKPTWASSEVSGGMSIGPIDMPEMSAAKANDGVINSDPNQGMLEANVWMTMGGKNHWWKVDLGSEYHLHSIEITWPQNAGMIQQGAMAYSVEVAGDFEQTFDNFSETYRTAIDQRDNQRTNTTLDPRGQPGRCGQVRLHKSGIFADTPMVGKYPIYGAEEITVYGGLLFSETLDVDYRTRKIQLPPNSTASTLLAQLQMVKGGSLELRAAKDDVLSGEMMVSPGAFVIARDATGQLAEQYFLE